MMDSYAVILTIIFLACGTIGFGYLLYDSHKRIKDKMKKRQEELDKLDKE